jgi:enoyl-CoA hydratase/carnithine racemase
MSTKSFPETYRISMLAEWENITQVKKPIIAAVNGFALGGGCVKF